MNPDGTEVKSFFDDSSKLGGGLSWAPDNKLVVVSAINVSDLSNQIPAAELAEFLVMDVNTRDVVAHLSDKRVRYNTNWSFDSRKLAYLTNYEIIDNVAIYKELTVLDIDIGEETILATFDSIGNPVWSPVDDVIAFSAGMFEEEDSNIYLINGDGTDLRQITEDGFYSVTSWSPDGRKLAIYSIETEFPESEIFVLDLESGELEQITDNDSFDAYPVWIQF